MMSQKQVSILFSDVSGFTKLRSSELNVFIQQIVPAFERVITKHNPLVKNTWGDAIFIVFDTAENAAECALALRDVVRDKDWSADGIHTDLSMRIGLHNAHAYIVKDPITGLANAFGEHINQAARLEPVVTPNEVFVTEGFMRALQAHNPKKLQCDEVGRLPLAKGWGESLVHCLRRKTDRAFSQEMKDQLVARSESIEKLMPSAQLLFSGNEVARSYTSKILEHVDKFHLTPGIVRRNWTIKARYDTDTIYTEGVITESIQWVYELINLRNERVDYAIELLGSTDLESKAEPFSLHRILEDGREVQILTARRKKKPKTKGHAIFTTLNEVVRFEPGDRVKLELRHYVNRWPACHGKDAIIHNSFAPREVSFDNRLEIEGEKKVGVGVIFDRGNLDPVDVVDMAGTKRHIFNIPSPMLRDQAVEIVLKLEAN